MTDWARIQIQWTWNEIAWILGHSGKGRLEDLISYGRDCRDLAENPTPPLVAWAVDKWLKEHEEPIVKKPIKRGPPEL